MEYNARVECSEFWDWDETGRGNDVDNVECGMGAGVNMLMLHSEETGWGWENRCVDESTAMATRVGRGPGDELKWGRTRARRDGNRDRVHAKGMYIHSDLRESE